MSVSKKMLDSYLETMLRSSNDMDTDEPLDKNYSISEVSKEFGELNPMANDGEVIMESVKLAESVLRTIEKLESSPSKNEALLAEGTLRKDLKYRVKQDQDKKFYIQFQSKTTGGWIVANAKTFASQEAAHEYLKAN